MKTLGLIGGMSWESTTLYYQHLNRMARARLGGQHSARLILWSVDFAPIAAMQAAGEWDKTTAVLVDAARRLELAGAEAILIGANTMHLMADAVQAAVSAPVLHVADATAAAVIAAGARKPLLLATRFTMEKDFYRDRLRAGGVEAAIPPADARNELHRIIYEELVQGVFTGASKQALLAMIEAARRDEDVDAVILGCTELSFLVKPEDLAEPLLDTTEIHARAAMDFALAG
jgi:aspartate racemase